MNHFTETPPSGIAQDAEDHILSYPSGQDTIVQERTANGGRAVFVSMGVYLKSIDLSSQNTQILILSPSRGMADQIYKQANTLAAELSLDGIRRVLCTNDTMSARQQGEEIRAQVPHLVIGTPGRVLDMIHRRALDLGGLKVLYMDEMEMLLEMGFGEMVAEIHQLVRGKRGCSVVMSCVDPGAMMGSARP